jgi:hypothetical protein
MTNAFSLFRSLTIYGICLPLAIFLGYLLATPLDRGTDLTIGVVALALMIPFFVRWHHLFLAFSWNLGAVIFFLPGKPSIFLPACAISFTVSILQYILNRNLKPINVPAVTLPLVALVLIALITARFTGGMGLKVTGSATYGGRRYLGIFAAIAGYYALTCKHVPVEQAPLYIKLFFLGFLASLIGGLSNVVGAGMYWIFLIFPGDPMGFQAASNSVVGDLGQGIERPGWILGLSTAVVPMMFAFYGLRGIFDLRRPWRLLLFFACIFGSLFGGYRSALISIIMMAGLQFYFEGLFRSRLLPIFVLGAILCAAAVFPLTDKLPLSVQRSLSFLPGIHIDPRAEMDAQGSTDWRIQLWRRSWPEVPSHLLLGRGYAIDPTALEMMNTYSMRATTDSTEAFYLAGDYHSGPLSIILTFGVPGTLAFLAFLYGSIKVLYKNYLHGPPELRKINTMLLTAFISKTIFFWGAFGSFYSDLVGFTGLIGLSVALNGGVCVPALVPVMTPVFKRFRLANATPSQ